jgi:hypothetical protein
VREKEGITSTKNDGKRERVTIGLGWMERVLFEREKFTLARDIRLSPPKYILLSKVH